MLNKYQKEIDLLLKWYDRAKVTTIKAESLDPQNTGYIQPLHEQRYALDHFVRAIKYSKDDINDTKILKAINSSIGHLQRAYSDSIEWILISVKDEFLKVLQPYTNELINQVFPEYYQTIRSDIEDITEIVNEYKNQKSVEQASVGNETQQGDDLIPEEELEKLNTITKQYVDIEVVEKLCKHLKTLHKKQSSLIEAKKRDKKNEFSTKVFWPIVTAVVASLITAVIMFFIKS